MLSVGASISAGGVSRDEGGAVTWWYGSSKRSGEERRYISVYHERLESLD